MAVKKEFRGKNYGKLLIQEIEKYAKNHDYTTICLSAQALAVPFYENLNYIKKGAAFMEANIEHSLMVKHLSV